MQLSCAQHLMKGSRFFKYGAWYTNDTMRPFSCPIYITYIPQRKVSNMLCMSMSHLRLSSCCLWYEENCTLLAHTITDYTQWNLASQSSLVLFLFAYTFPSSLSVILKRKSMFRCCCVLTNPAVSQWIIRENDRVSDYVREDGLIAWRVSAAPTSGRGLDWYVRLHHFTVAYHSPQLSIGLNIYTRLWALMLF